jgi:hypothetical protein
MSRAYLLIILPAALVGVCYFAVFHSLGMPVKPAPFLGAAAGFVAAVLVVRYYQRRKSRRPGS